MDSVSVDLESGRTLLEVRNLVTEFRTDGQTMRAVNEISFAIEKGETIGVVGESGSGKSVTALSVMGLIPNPPGRITGGEIMFNSRSRGLTDLVKLPEKDMRSLRGNEIAMIFQEPMTSLNPVYTCGEQVMEAILRHKTFEGISKGKNAVENIIRGFDRAFSFITGPIRQATKQPLKRYYTSKEKQARALTISLFEQTQLPDPERIFYSYPHQISGGQKQRVMIAMAMSCRPQLLIADEPTTALDVTVQKTILELMKELQTENDMSILFITHDLGVIAELADRVVVMYKGEIVEQGPVLDIFADPKHPYTKGLLACRPPLNKRLQVLPTVSDFMKTDDEGNLVEITQSVQEVLHSVFVTPEERKQQHEKLYANTPVLQLKNIRTYFPTTRNIFGKTTSWKKAVDDISFDVYPGETLGLVGESGCGKTTLGRTVLRLIEPTGGQIIFKGKDITHIPTAEMRAMRKDIQIIFQDPYSSLNPRITIGNAITEPMRVHGIGANDAERKAKALELLRRVNMNESHYYRYPHEFSGGQRQRICIARALALNPQFIICDESVSALDVSVQAQVLNLLNELKQEFKFTYIFISHDLSVVKFMSDRMVVMNNGKIEEMGDADAIYNTPQTEYTQKLISAIPKGELDDIRAAIARKRMTGGRFF